MHIYNFKENYEKGEDVFFSRRTREVGGGGILNPGKTIKPSGHK